MFGGVTGPPTRLPRRSARCDTGDGIRAERQRRAAGAVAEPGAGPVPARPPHPDQPDQVGLTVGTGLRRTPGLRREELATLAGISIDYYVRLERGKETRPSPSVLDALARALRLDDAEHQHLRELAARAARYAPEPPPPPSRTVRPHLKLLLETLRPNPAYVISRSMDLLAWNPGGLALYAGLDDWPATQRNLARYLFLHPAARDPLPRLGRARSAAASPGCAPWPAPPRTPPTSPTSSANSCSRARTSPSSGSATTSSAASGPRRPSTTPRSAPSPSAPRACTSKAPPANASASTPPNPAPPTTTPCSCST